MISPLKKQLKVLIVVVLICAAGVVGLSRLALIMQARLEGVFAANQQLVSYEENKKIFAQESKSLAAITNRVITLEAYRITDDTVPQLLSSFELLAQQDAIGFTITNVQIPGSGNNKKLLIDFSATGSAQHIETFLADLSHQTYQINLLKLSLFVDTTPDASASADTPQKTVSGAPAWQALASIQVTSY